MNKNSGMSLAFHPLQLSFTLLVIAQTVLAQICVKYSGSVCDQCAANYQLVNGQCLSISSADNNSPTLIFQDSPGSQKMLYRVNPVVVLIQSGNSAKQSEQSIVSEFQVSKVSHPTLGNYYILDTNKTVLNNFNISLPNSSILTEITPNNLTLAKILQNDSSSSTEVPGMNGSSINQQLNLTQIAMKQNNASSSLTQVRQQYSLTKINPQTNQAAQLNVSQAQLNLTLINEMQPVSNLNVSLSELKEGNISSNDSQEYNFTIVSRNNNNNNLLFQLQQINQRLTKANQITNLIPITQIQSKQPANESPPPGQSSNNQLNELSLTQVGQKLTYINQQLVEAQLKSASSAPAASQPTTQSQLEPQQTKIRQKLQLNLSQYITNSSNSSNIPDLNGVNSSRVTEVDWIKATRYELYNLTYIPQVSQAKFKDNTNSTTIFTFRCTEHLSVFEPPSSSSKGAQLYSLYSARLTASLANKYKQFTNSDRSTLCFDPPFHQSFKYLTTKYKSILNEAPLFAAYYQFCGFGKNFRIFFIDDSNYPRIVIRQGVILVDLFRMMPTEVLFEKYEDTILA